MINRVCPRLRPPARLPTRGDRGRGALVPALRAVLSRCRGAAGRTRHPRSTIGHPDEPRRLRPRRGPRSAAADQSEREHEGAHRRDPPPRPTSATHLRDPPPRRSHPNRTGTTPGPEPRQTHDSTDRPADTGRSVEPLTPWIRDPTRVW